MNLKENLRSLQKFKNKEINNMVGLDIKFNRPKKSKFRYKMEKNFTASQISKKILKLVEMIKKVLPLQCVMTTFIKKNT